MGDCRSDFGRESVGWESKPGKRQLLCFRGSKRARGVRLPSRAERHLYDVRSLAGAGDRNPPASTRPLMVIHRWTVRNSRHVLSKLMGLDERRSLKILLARQIHNSPNNSP